GRRLIVCPPRRGASVTPASCASTAHNGSSTDGRSLDHLIRPQQQGLRDGEAERLVRLKVDHELELRGLLDRKIAWSCALQDLVDIAGGEIDRVCLTRPV